MMNNNYDVECPYCGKEIYINHDDGRGYEPDTVHLQQCKHCDHIFGFDTTIHFTYETRKVPCQNGENHKLKKVTSSRSKPVYMCEYCNDMFIDPSEEIINAM